MEGIRVVVRGRVQGVGFRWWTRRLARELGLTGSVRNLADGSVEILAHGPRPPLDAFIEAVGSGPPGAHVEQVLRTPFQFESRTRDFDILS